MALKRKIPVPTRRVTTKETWELNRKQGRFLRVVTSNTAIDVLRRDQRAGMFPRNDNAFTTWVDRNPRKTEGEVRFGGRIQYIQKQPLSAVYRFIWQEIHRLSPVQRKKRMTGRAAFRRRRYRDSHAMIVDGRTVLNIGEGRVSPNFRTMETKFGLGAAKEVRFVNIQPYARRIEHGSTYNRKELTGRGKRPIRVRRGPHAGKTRRYLKLYWSPQAKRGVYQVVAKRAAQRFKGVAQIDYRRMQLAQTGYRFKHEGARIDQFYPVIRVRPDRSGLRV